MTIPAKVYHLYRYKVYHPYRCKVYHLLSGGFALRKLRDFDLLALSK